MSKEVGTLYDANGMHGEDVVARCDMPGVVHEGDEHEHRIREECDTSKRYPHHMCEPQKGDSVEAEFVKELGFFGVVENVGTLPWWPPEIHMGKQRRRWC